MLESILIAKPSNPNDIFTNSNVQLSIEDIPFFDEHPLHNKNKRYGFQFSSKYNKIYLTVEGKSKDFLAIFNQNEIQAEINKGNIVKILYDAKQIDR